MANSRAIEIVGQWIDDNLPHSEANFGADEGIVEALEEAGCLTPEADAITRVTVVKYPGGRFVEEWNVHDVDLSIQDEGRTLKVFYWKGEE